MTCKVRNLLVAVWNAPQAIMITVVTIVNERKFTYLVFDGIDLKVPIWALNWT